MNKKKKTVFTEAEMKSCMTECIGSDKDKQVCQHVCKAIDREVTDCTHACTDNKQGNFEQCLDWCGGPASKNNKKQE